MTRISANPTAGQIRLACAALLTDYASEKGLTPVQPSGRRKTRGDRSAPTPEVIWRDGAKAVWQFFVMPGAAKLSRLLPNLKRVQNTVVGIDASGNIGIIQPAHLLQFLKLNSSSLRKEEIRSLEKDISSYPPYVPEFRFRGTVEKNHQFVKDHFSLRIRAILGAKPAPGQFLQVMCDPAPHAQNPKYRSLAWGEGKWPKLRGIEMRDHRPFLRRPFSVASYGPPARRDDARELRGLGREWLHLIQWAEAEYEIIYLRQPGGAGTGALTQYEAGDTIDIVGPLGKGFRLEPPPDVAVLVGGGIGAPPLLFLAEELARRGVDTKVFLGALSRSRIPFRLRGKTTPRTPRFERLGVSPVICTDDGSAGHHGIVTGPVSRYLEQECENLQGTKIFACGPRPMLAALRGIASRCDIPCDVLLEERMACGFGACISCVCAVKEPGQKAGFTRICTEGPAFDVKKVMWHA